MYIIQKQKANDIYNKAASTLAQIKTRMTFLIVWLYSCSNLFGLGSLIRLIRIHFSVVSGSFLGKSHVSLACGAVLSQRSGWIRPFIHFDPVFLPCQINSPPLGQRCVRLLRCARRARAPMRATCMVLHNWLHSGVLQRAWALALPD